MVFFVRKNMERLIRFDAIRFLKLLEITQYAILSFFTAFYVSINLNNMTPPLDKKKSRFKLFVEVVINIVLLTIIAYYIGKFVRIFPFLGKYFSNKYKPDSHNEASIGISVGLSYIYSKTQLVLADKIKFLIETFPKERLFYL